MNNELKRHQAIKTAAIAATFFFCVGLLPTLTENTVGIDAVKSFGLACYQDGGLGVFGHDAIVSFNDSVFVVIFYAIIYMYYR